MEAALEMAACQDVPREAKLQAFSLLIKIISNVLEPPTRNVEEASKYRCLNSSSNALQQRLLRHGPAFENLLFALGFVRTDDPPPRVAQLQPDQQQQQQGTEPQKRQTEKQESPHEAAQPSAQQQQRTEREEQEEGPHPYYYVLPETADLGGLVEALQLLRATTESLKLAGGSSSSDQKSTAGGDAAAGAPAGSVDTSAASSAKSGPAVSTSLHPTDNVRLPLTTSRAIRGQATSTHAKNQAALRQLREEQRERFEHRAETTRSTKSTAAAGAAVVSRKDSGTRRGTDAAGAKFEKKWSPEAATDAAASGGEATCAAPQAAAAGGSGSGKKLLHKGSSSLQAAGRFFRKLCRGKGVGSRGK